MVLEALQETIGGIGEDVKGFIADKPITSALIGAGVVATGVGVAIASSSGKKNKKRAKRTSKSKGRSRDRKFISKQKWEKNYKRKTKGRRYKTKNSRMDSKKSRRNKQTSKRRKGIHYTKNGQPYKIMSDGKARFIKKTKRRTK